MNENTRWKKRIMLFLISQNLSIFGSSVVGYSIIWYITLKTSSGLWITVSTIATLLPQVIISLWAGVVADRYDRKRIIMLSDGFTAFVTLVAFAGFCLGKESLPFLIAASFMRSLGGGLQGPAVNALYPQIVPEEQLVRINGINQTISNILLLISPAVGGFILGTLGIKWAFLVDVATAASAILIMGRLKVSPQKREREAGSTVLGELSEGVRYTWTNPLLRTIMVCYAVTFILITPASALSPLMVARTFGDEVWRLTANEIFWTVGSLLGGAFVAWKGEFGSKINVIAAALAGFGITFALMGFSTVFWLYLMLDCICGMFLPALVTAQTVLIQTSTEPCYMGRVFSLLQFVSQGVMPVAILGFGPLSDRIPIQAIMIVCGTLLVLWGLWFVKAAKRAETKTGQ